LEECGPGGQDSRKYESGFNEEKRVEDNKPQLQKPIPNPKPFEGFDLHFDDPTDDVIAGENQDLYDEMPPIRDRSGRWK
jgi:hypothetical protein